MELREYKNWEVCDMILEDLPKAEKLEEFEVMMSTYGDVDKDGSVCMGCAATAIVIARHQLLQVDGYSFVNEAVEPEVQEVMFQADKLRMGIAGRLDLTWSSRDGRLAGNCYRDFPDYHTDRDEFYKQLQLFRDALKEREI